MAAIERERETRIIFAISVFANAISEVLNETQLKRIEDDDDEDVQQGYQVYHRIYILLPIHGLLRRTT